MRSLIAVLCSVPMLAQAALIDYIVNINGWANAYNDTPEYNGPVHGVGTITVDTDSQSIVALAWESEIYSLSWTGFAPLVFGGFDDDTFPKNLISYYDAVINDAFEAVSDSYARIDISLPLWHPDRSPTPYNDPVERFDQPFDEDWKLHIYHEDIWISNSWFDVIGKRMHPSVPVPEPTTIPLFSLGLIGVLTTRKIKKERT